MPRLSELTGAQPAEPKRVRLSELQAADANNSDFAQMITGPRISPVKSTALPTVAGPMGFSKEFREATGLSGVEGFLGSAKPALADVFGNYEDVTNALQKVAPGSVLTKDEDGYEVLELPNGSRFAMNKPGIQGHEVASAAGNIAAFTPAGKLAGMGGSLAAKAAIGGAASGVTDVALQKLAGKEEIDPIRLGMSAAGGAAGELLSPVIGKIAKSGIDKLKSFFGGSDEAAIQMGRAYAEQLGIQNPTDDFARQIAARWDEIKAGADPKTIVAEAETGVRLTQGQKTGDYGQLTREEMLRASDSEAGKFMRGIDDSNKEAIDAYLARTRNTMAGGQAGATVGESFEKIGQGLKAEKDAQKGVVKSLYDKVSESKAIVDRGAIDQLPGRLAAALQEKDIALHPELTKASQIVFDEMAEKVSKLPKEVTGLSIKTIEQERRILNNRIASAKDPADKRALMTMKNAFDDWYGDLADSAIIKGDPEVIEAMKAARDANTVLNRRFGSAGKETDIGRKMVAKLVAGEASPEEVAQAALGASQVSKPAGAQFVRRLKSALKPETGPENPAWGELKAAVLQKMTTGKGGETLGPQAIVGNLKESLRNRKSMIQELYTPEEIKGMWKAVQVFDALVPKGMKGRSSGTGERIFAMAEQYLKGIPVVGKPILDAMRAPGQAAVARNAFQPLRPRTDLDALLTAGSAAYGQQQGK